MGSHERFEQSQTSPAPEIIFSLEKGQVWAHWLGSDVTLRFGSAQAVSEMMVNFLAQMALGERMMRGEWGAELPPTHMTSAK